LLSIVHPVAKDAPYDSAEIFSSKRGIPMRIAIQADDGDEVSIKADVVSVEQAIVTLEIENALYSSETEIDAVTLTLDKARELANALLSVTEAIEFVSTPKDPLDRELRQLSKGAWGYSPEVANVDPS
jgi:hypothetical protein